MRYQFVFCASSASVFFRWSGAAGLTKALRIKQCMASGPLFNIDTILSDMMIPFIKLNGHESWLYLWYTDTGKTASLSWKEPQRDKSCIELSWSNRGRGSVICRFNLLHDYIITVYISMFPSIWRHISDILVLNVGFYAIYCAHIICSYWYSSNS